MTTTNQTKFKKSLFELIKTTVIGGFLIVMPAYLAVLVFYGIMKKLIALTISLLKPITYFPGVRESDIATLSALIIFLLICFIAGLVAQSNYARIFRNALEPVFKKVPAYLVLRRLTSSIIKMKEGEKYDPAFVALGDSTEALSPGFLMEKHENATCTVFVPAVPTPTVGSIYIVPNHRIYPVNVPVTDMVKFISRWGEASPALLAAIQQIELPQSSSEQINPADN